MGQVDLFIDELQQHGLERFRIFYIGLEGIVVDNKDPQGRGRIQCKIPNIADDNVIYQWIRPAFEGSGVGRGTFWPPEVGDIVRVHFDRGRPDFPLYYIGGHYYTDKAPSLLAPSAGQAPRRRGFQTRAGHYLAFDDTPGAESLTLHWHKPAAGDAALSDPSASASPTTGDHSIIHFSPDGSIAILAKGGEQRIVLDTVGNQVQIQSKQGASSTTVSIGDKVDIRDPSGNCVTLSSAGIGLISLGPVSVAAPSVNLAVGGASIGAPDPIAPLEAPLRGETYTRARHTRATIEKAQWRAIGAAARVVAGTMQANAFTPIIGTLAQPLAAFFVALAGACDSVAGAIDTFEAGKDIYLSKKNKVT